jgi:4-amino-4-deoxy-L-arabinose transferase-like glycosyltransferase
VTGKFAFVTIRKSVLAALAILILATLFRLAMIGQFDLGNDEAHYYMYAVHPALSYFDHPLMVALLIRVGMAVGGANAFGVRLLSPVLFLLSSLVLSMIALYLGSRPGILLRTVILLNAIPLFGFLGSMLILPDAALSFFWLLYVLVSLVLFTRMKDLSPGSRFQGWILLGVLFGLSILSKYNGFLLAPATFIMLLSIKSLRPILRTWAPYLALGLGFLVATPLFLWNLENNGASFRFQALHGLGGSIHFSWVPFSQMVFGQMGYISPILFVLLLWILWKRTRPSTWNTGPSSRADLARALLVGYSALPILFFNAVGIFHPILPHWPSTGYLTAIPLLALFWEENVLSRVSSWIRYGAGFGILLSFLVTLQLFFRPILLPASVPLWVDITNDLFGFRAVSRTVREEMDRHRDWVTTPFFFAAQHFNTADELAFYLKDPYHTICLGKRFTQFDFWNDPHRFIGKSGLFVSTDKYPVDPRVFYPKGMFDRIVPLPPLTVYRRGYPARVFYLYWLLGLRQVPWRQ